MKLIKHDVYIKKLLKKDTKLRKEYKKWDPAFEVGEMLSEARVIKGLTQTRLAELINTKQQSIARAESGKHLPSLSFLVKIAMALKTHLIIRFGFIERDYAHDFSTTMAKQKDVKTHANENYGNTTLNYRNETYNHLAFSYPERKYV